MIDANGMWWPDLTKKGYEAFDCYTRYLLVSGPRKCAKTRSLVHKALRHHYENPGAVGAVLAKTTRVAKASGVWSDLVDWATPQWVNAGIGFKVIKPPASTDYKLTYYKVSSHTGQPSEIQLHSLDHASQVEEKFKGQAFSFIYVSEADQFLDQKAFNRLADQLRGIVAYDRAQMILDCNPPEDGQDSWLWDLFETRVAKMRAEGNPMAGLYKHIRVPLEDNHFLDPREREELIERYKNDPFDHKRYVLGEWVRDKSKTHFGDALTPAHVLGDVSSGDKSQWQVLVPAKNTLELFTGWDLGDNNHAIAFAAKRTVGEKVAFDVFDELEVVGREVSIQDVTEAAVERIEYWEKYMKDEYGIEKIRWRHWSDNSVKRYRAAADSHDELLVRDYSNGKINLISVVKGGGSVRQRVNLLKRLLNERLIYFSASLPATIKMLKELPKGPSQAEVVPRDDPRKHMFDALTYMLISESPMALEEKQKPTVRPRPVIISRR